MKYQAQWGPKGFLVSPDKIVTFDGFSTSIELNDDSQNDTSGTTPTNNKGIKPQSINLSITYTRAAGVDPRAQFEEWSSIVGQNHPFYIAGKRFGPESLRLKKVDLSGLMLSNDGTFLSCTIAASFDEYAPAKSSGGTGGTGGSGTYDVKPATPQSERQKDAAAEKQKRLLDEKEEAMQENYENRVWLAKYNNKKIGNGEAGGTGGGYKYRDENLIHSTT